MNGEPLMPWKTLSATLSVGTSTEGWNLSEHPGEEMDKPRVFVVDVFFAAPFVTAPVVHLGLTGFDIDRQHSARLGIRVSEITNYGFKAEISTWHDSRVYSVQAAWLAIGA
jgi:H-type lectin domain-containing protein